MRLVTRGAKTGQCNICGKYGPLTEDHIPPKGVPRLGQVAMMNLIDMLAAERPSKSTRYSQDGVKYRTICSDCNSGLLGARYDPELISMANYITDYVSSRLYLPPQLEVLIKPNRLCRSVVGHLLAHRVDSYREGDVISGLTDYFLDETADFPNDLKLYYWVYPYKDQVAITGAGLSQ